MRMGAVFMDRGLNIWVKVSRHERAGEGTGDGDGGQGQGPGD